MKIFQSSIFRALCAIVIGIMILKYPQDGVTWLTMAIGALFLVSGIISLVAYWQGRRHAGEYTVTDRQGRVLTGGQPTFPIVGAGSVILGLVLTLTPNAFIHGLMYMLALVLIMGAITQLTTLVAARRMGGVPLTFWIFPALILLTGVFVVLKPMESAELPMLILGWCSILYGVTELTNALMVYRLRKAFDKGALTPGGRLDEEAAYAEEISSVTNTDSGDVIDATADNQ